MAADEDSVLGKLPRSRPGNRSAKRSGAVSQQPASAKRPAGGSRRPARPPKPAAGAPKRTAARPHPRPPGRSDPLSSAARAAAGVADTGLKAASALTREALRRLPRP